MPPDISVESILFQNISSKDSFLDKVISDEGMSTLIAKVAKEKGKSIDEVREDIFHNWNFGVGKLRVDAGVDNKQKLHAFADVELVSRDGIEDRNISVKISNDSRHLQFSEKSVQQEKDIIEKWGNKSFVSE